MPAEFVSCLGVATAYSLVELCKSLDQLQFSGVNRVQSATPEHGLASGIILLGVAMTESALNRARYIAGEGPPGALKFFESHFENEEVSADLEELYVLRDVIIHNHMWAIEIPDQSNLDDPRIRFTLLSGYGDKKFERVLNKSVQKTNRLSLNVIPTRLSRRDAVTVLEVVWQVCRILQSKDSRYFPIENIPFRWGASTIYRFPDLVAYLSGRWKT